MIRSSLFIVLAIVTTAWSLAQTTHPGGNRACAQRCAANFASRPGSECPPLAAHGRGPSRVCGSRSTNPHEKLCGGACSDTSSDSNNYGAYRNVCIPGSTCSSSACVCTNSGKPPRNEQCPDLKSNSSNWPPPVSSSGVKTSSSTSGTLDTTASQPSSVSLSGVVASSSTLGTLSTAGSQPPLVSLSGIIASSSTSGTLSTASSQPPAVSLSGIIASSSTSGTLSTTGSQSPPVSSSGVTTSSSTSGTLGTTSSQPPPVSSSGVTISSSTSGAPGTCPSYAASCSNVMNGLLASNSIAGPQLVDYRIQSAMLGITTPSDFLAALGPDPCQIYTDPTEYNSCVELLANSQFVGQLTDITTELLSAFQTCASDFAAGEPDYQIIVNQPNNATCPEPRAVRRHEKRTFDIGEDYDLTRSMLEGIEYSRSFASAPLLGPLKSSDFKLSRKQLSTCSQTGVCFETCPDCRDQQTYCGSQATIITTAVCASLAVATRAGVTVLSGSLCGVLCGPAAGLCAPFCARAAGGLSGLAVRNACTVLRNVICDPLIQRCANCNSANNGVCDSGSTQCCAGETGTQCGAGCCCCPQCFAPGGINCACTPAPC